MSSIVKITKNIELTPWGIIKGIVQVAWEGIVITSMWKETAALFGIRAEDVVSTNSASQRLIDDSNLDTFRTKMALKLQSDSTSSVISKLEEATNAARGRVQSIFYYAANKTVEGLPITNIKARNINENVLITAISNTDINPIILSSNIDTPTKEEYVKYSYQGLYGYSNLTNSMIYNGKEYYLTDITYNYTTNLYDVTITQYEDMLIDVYTRTVISITSVDATYDNKNEVVSERTVKTGATSGTVISDVTTEVSNTNTSILVGTVSNSDTTTGPVTSTVTNGTVLNTVYLTHNAGNTVSYIIAEYYTTNSANWKYWLYDISLTTYPGIDDSSSSVTVNDLLPVMTIRNNLVNTQDTDHNGELYKSTEHLLKILGIDLKDMTDEVNKNPDIASIDDAIIHFGLSPSDTDPVVSEVLYETFYTLYQDDSLTTSTNGHRATYKSGPMNLGLVWESQSLISTGGSIGPVGTYKHKIVSTTLTPTSTTATTNLELQFQDTTFSYSTITLTNVNNVSFISRGGLQGTSNKAISDPEFNIPISFEMVKRLSSIKQTIFLAKALRITFYTLNIQHLKWYQTGAFAIFIQIIGIIIIIVGCIYSACSLSSIGYALLIYAGATLALKIIAKYVKTPWLRAVLTIIVVVIAFWAGGGFDSGLMNVQALTGVVTAFATGVSTYSQMKLSELNTEKTQFERSADTRMKEIQDASASYNKGLTVSDVEELNQYDPIKEYITSKVDYMMYVARDVQFNFDSLYDYDIIVKDYYNNRLRIALA